VIKRGTDFKPDALRDLLSSLTEAQFVPYVTSVGGSGLGILSPYGQYRMDDKGAAPITPPDTPGVFGKSLELEEPLPDPLRASFDSKTVLDLGNWAETRGRWLYV
jgi:hypothetical protein